MTPQLRHYYEVDLLLPLELALAAAQETEGAEQIVEELLRARSMVWAKLDGYYGPGGYFYGRSWDMPRGFHQACGKGFALRLVDRRGNTL